jgi:hypothetical protein
MKIPKLDRERIVDVEHDGNSSQSRPHDEVEIPPEFVHVEQVDPELAQRARLRDDVTSGEQWMPIADVVGGATDHLDSARHEFVNEGAGPHRPEDRLVHPPVERIHHGHQGLGRPRVELLARIVVENPGSPSAVTHGGGPPAV